MKIYNSLSRKKEEFVPRVEGKVGMYVCGPTVYDNAHLGHGRSAVAFDVIRRYLIYKGYDVNYVSNYTDIDDKMIKRAAEEGISVKALADKVIPEYGADYGALNVMQPDVQPLATEYVEAMVDLVKVLESKGFTYVLDDGVYYDISKFKDYGKLSGNTLEDLQSGARIEVKDDKRNPQDFVLWKFRKEGEDDFWASPWGDGRPGWHIECSAMTRECLGEGGFDIHGGGLDLTFPHHECEIAQSEGAFGDDSFAKYWMHNGFINIDNEKMSKSLGNFFTLKEIFEKYDPLVVRFMFLQTHYRNPVNFSHVLLDQAAAALKRIHGFVRDLRLAYDDLPENVDAEFFVGENELKAFEFCMDNDFDTSGALGVLFDLIKSVNKLRVDGALCKEDVDGAEVFLKKIDEVLAVIFVDDVEMDESFVTEVEGLIEKRRIAREAKDYAVADEVRDRLKEMGVEIEDGADGVVWRVE